MRVDVQPCPVHGLRKRTYIYTGSVEVYVRFRMPKNKTKTWGDHNLEGIDALRSLSMKCSSYQIIMYNNSFSDAKQAGLAPCKI
ncbi:unnamed protein product [Urochloa humidicola]